MTVSSPCRVDWRRLNYEAGMALDHVNVHVTAPLWVLLIVCKALLAERLPCESGGSVCPACTACHGSCLHSTMWVLNASIYIHIAASWSACKQHSLPSTPALSIALRGLNPRAGFALRCMVHPALTTALAALAARRPEVYIRHREVCVALSMLTTLLVAVDGSEPAAAGLAEVLLHSTELPVHVAFSPSEHGPALPACFPAIRPSAVGMPWPCPTAFNGGIDLFERHRGSGALVLLMLCIYNGVVGTVATSLYTRLNHAFMAVPLPALAVAPVSLPQRCGNAAASCLPEAAVRAGRSARARIANAYAHKWARCCLTARPATLRACCGGTR